MKIENTIEINKPPSEVYQFLLDKENITLWLSNYEYVEHLDGEEEEEGATYKLLFNEQSGKREMTLLLEHLEEDKKLRTTLSSRDLDIKINAQLTPIHDDETLLEVVIEHEPQTLGLKFLSTFKRSAITKRYESDIERLKAAVEMYHKEPFEEEENENFN